MRKALKLGKWVLISLITLVVGYILIALILSFFSTSPRSVNCETSQTVYLYSNGIHLNLVLPKLQVDTALASQLNIPRDIEYLSFGWGDKAFYLNTPTWKELKLTTAFKAIILKSKSAMHVSHFSRTRKSWKPIAVCNTQIALFNQYLAASFKRNQQGDIITLIAKGYSQNDHFYEAVGHYSCLNTCNNWVNKALKKAGIKTAIWSPFDFGVLSHL